MNVAIVHYHLDRGGVTQVILNHLDSLCAVPVPNGPERVALVSGLRRGGWPADSMRHWSSIPVDHVWIPALDYDADTPPVPRKLADDIRDGLKHLGYSAAETLVHVHNHALGKNRSLPGALRLLAREGFRLLLQIHDFAEDYRHTNYARMAAAASSLAADGAADLNAVLYPQAEHIHYATLNRRDAAILRAAGVPDQRLHLLPNPIPDVPDCVSPARARQEVADRAGLPASGPLLLYPVRCIRRKNVGESLLWSAAGNRRAHVGLTLPPASAAEKPSYLRWKKLAADLGLACHFELGSRGDLAWSQLRAAADRLLTTSVSEGFGMVFLEPWLAGKPLAGRDLPEVSADYLAAGLQFDGLRPRLDVPVAWIDRVAFRDCVADWYSACRVSYGRRTPGVGAVAAQVEEWMQGDVIDFARLDPDAQSRVIGRVAGDQRARQQLLDFNPWMEPALAGPDTAAAAVIEQNAQSVRRGFGLESSGRRLQGLYHAIAAAPPSDRLEMLEHAGRVLDAFLSLDRFYLVRVLP